MTDTHTNHPDWWAERDPEYAQTPQDAPGSTQAGVVAQSDEGPPSRPAEPICLCPKGLIRSVPGCPRHSGWYGLFGIDPDFRTTPKQRPQHVLVLTCGEIDALRAIVEVRVLMPRLLTRLTQDHNHQETP